MTSIDIKKLANADIKIFKKNALKKKLTNKGNPDIVDSSSTTKEI